MSSYGGTVAWEVGAAFISMTTGKKSPVSLRALKSKVGDLHHQFSGCGQHDSHEFLVFLLTWLHEDLKGRELSALLSSGNISGHLTTEGLTSELSIISLLFQGEHKHVITCKNCHHESISLEPFNILSLSLPASGNCTLTNLLQRYYECCCIEYSCPGCNKRGESSRKTFIQRLPPMLLLHFNRFEYISARKKHNYVDFPLDQLSLREHASESSNVSSYSLCAVSNHYGTMSGGHYTSYCKPPQGNVWYQCDDKTVTKLRTPIKTSAAYLLLYDSIHIDV